MGITMSSLFQTLGFPSLSVRGFEVELNILSTNILGVDAGKELLFLERNASLKDNIWWLSSAKEREGGKMAL